MIEKNWIHMPKLPLTIIFILFISINAYGSIAKVVRIVGNVNVLHENGTSNKLTINSKIEIKDTINVNSKSKVQIRFQDNTLITLGRDSIFSVEEYLFDSSKNSKAKFQVIKGSLKFLTGTIGKIAPEHFKIRTKTATMGVRGTYVAVSFSNNILGVLYLGEGNGVYVQNEFGRTDLTEIGQGVFIALNETPKKPSFWTRAQSNNLLKDLSFDENDALPKVNKNYLNESSIHANLSLYSFTNHTDNADADTAGSTIEFDYTTPTYYNFNANVAFFSQSPFGFMKDGVARAFAQKQSIMHKASIAWHPSNSIVRVGRQNILTPLTNSTTLRGLPSLSLKEHWYKNKTAQDWWWTTPDSFEAITSEYNEIDDLKIVVSIASKFKRSTSKTFTSSLPAVNDFGRIYLAGIEHKTDKLKVQFYDLYADEFTNTAFLQADLLNDYDYWGYFTSAQYIHQRDTGSYNQKVKSSLWGLKVGGYYKGLHLWTALSQTSKNKAGEINSVLTPFNGLNAFTNSFALRNVFSRTYDSGLSSDGAYAADTTGKKIALEYYGNYDKLSQFSAMLSYSIFDQSYSPNKAKAYDLDLNYDFDKTLQGLSSNIKASKVNNSNFVSANENIVRLMVRYSF